MLIKRLLPSFWLMGGLLCCGGSVTADTPSAPVIDSQAETLLKTVADTVQSIQTLQIDVEQNRVIPNAKVQGKVTRYVDRWITHAVLKRPNLAHMEFQAGVPSKTDPNVFEMKPTGMMVSDGKTLWDYFAFQKLYRKTALTPEQNAPPLDNPIRDFFDPKNSFWSQVQTFKKEDRLRRLTLAGEETWQGQPYRVVSLEYVDDFEYPAERLQAIGGTAIYSDKLYIGSDNLIHRMQETHPIRGTQDVQVRRLTINAPVNADLFTFTPPEGSKPEPPRPTPLGVGNAAPDFTAEGINGTLKLSDFRGKIVVLDFWATWCGPCRKAMPHLKQVCEAVQGKDIVFLALCVWDDKATYEKWLAGRGKQYPFLFAFDPAAQQAKASIPEKLYSVIEIPTTYVIDREGKIAAFYQDHKENDTRLETALRKLGVEVAVRADADSSRQASK